MVRRTALMFFCALLIMGCRPASPTPTATSVTNATSLPESALITPGIPTQGLSTVG